MPLRKIISLDGKKNRERERASELEKREREREEIFSKLVKIYIV